MIVIVIRYFFFSYIFKECIISIPIRDKLIPIILYILHIICSRHHSLSIRLVSIEIPLGLCILVCISSILLSELRVTAKLSIQPFWECKLHYNVPIDSFLVRREVRNKWITSLVCSNCFISKLYETLLLVCDNPARFDEVLRFIVVFAMHKHSV